MKSRIDKEISVPCGLTRIMQCQFQDAKNSKLSIFLKDENQKKGENKFGQMF